MARENKEEMETPLYVLSPSLLVTVPQRNYFKIPKLYVTVVCLYKSVSSVLKHICVCLTKYSSCSTHTPGQSQADFDFPKFFVNFFLVRCPSTWGSLINKSLQLGLWIHQKRRSVSVLLSVPSLVFSQSVHLWPLIILHFAVMFPSHIAALYF